jgi:hypothetical protein
MTATLTIHYHRDFDGMVSAAILAHYLREQGEDPRWSGLNYDQRVDWENFQAGQRFAIVDFHFHPRAEYWFDHHATTFLTPELRAQYRPGERWCWDEGSPSCPPIILRHARERWSRSVPERFLEMARWSDIIDAARFVDVGQALFGDDAALRISRALAAAPAPDWSDTLVRDMIGGTLEELARRPDVERSWQRAVRNRDLALRQFPPTVESTEDGVVLFDASSNKIRRERFAAFFHHSDSLFSVGVIPTRSGFHVTVGRNPWMRSSEHRPEDWPHLGEVMETHGGGGHRSVGGANARSLEDARRIAHEVAAHLRRHLLARKP